MKNNPDLLQEAEVENDNAYLTLYSDKINEEDDNMKISMEEDHETVEYQETLKLDVKNIAKNKNKYGDQYMKLFIIHFLRKTIFFQNLFQTHVKIIQIGLNFYHMI